MPYTKTSLRAEQRALREEMRALGMSRRQVAAEFARRYRLRPRAAWRHAHGWSLTEAAQQINAYAAQAGISSGATVAMTAAHLCEHENWPGEGPQPMGRKPTPYLLSLLAAVYGCAVHDLLDVADCRRLPAADRLTLDKTAPGREDQATPPPGIPPVRSSARLLAVPPVSPVPEPAGAATPPELAALAVALLAVPQAQDRDQAIRLAAQASRIWKLRQTASYRELAADLPKALVTARMTELEPARDRPLAGLAALTHLYNAASSLAKSLGSFDLAGIAADRAVSTADRTGDPLLGGAAAYRLANVLLSAGQLGSAQAVAVSAADRLRLVMTATRSHTALWGALLATAALAAARMRAPAESWELLGEAKVAADLLTSEQADMFSIFGAASWLIHAVNIAADLGDGAEAIRRASQLPPGQLPRHLAERQTFLLIGKARGYALRGDVMAATMTLTEAEHEAPQELHHNPEARRLVQQLLPASPARNQLLRELAARMAAADTGTPSTGASR